MNPVVGLDPEQAGVERGMVNPRHQSPIPAVGLPHLGLPTWHDVGCVSSACLGLTGHAFEWIEADSNAGLTRRPEFLAINPIGKAPALVLDDGVVLAESAAILLHFAEGTAWLPPPGLLRTRVHEWLLFEQYSHEPYIAVAQHQGVEAHLSSSPIPSVWPSARGKVQKRST